MSLLCSKRWGAIVAVFVASLASGGVSWGTTNANATTPGDNLSAYGSWHFTTSEEAGTGGGFFVVTDGEKSLEAANGKENQGTDKELSKYLEAPPIDNSVKKMDVLEEQVANSEAKHPEKSQDENRISAQLNHEKKFPGPCGALEERMERRRTWLQERRAEQFALGGAPNAQLGIPDATWQWCEAHPEDEQCRMPHVTVFFSTEELRGGKKPEEYDRHMILMNRELQTCLRQHDGKR